MQMDCYYDLFNEKGPGFACFTFDGENLLFCSSHAIALSVQRRNMAFSAWRGEAEMFPTSWNSGS